MSLLEETLSALGVKTVEEAGTLIKQAFLRNDYWTKHYILSNNHTDSEAVEFLNSMADEFDNDIAGTFELNDGTGIEVSEWYFDEDEEDEDDDIYYNHPHRKWTRIRPVTPHWTEFEAINY